LHVIKIGPHAPKSSTDFFVLNYWRAHADAILTTAAIVRAEPGLSHALQGPHASELALYRKLRLQKSEPPLCAILTRAGDLPLDHKLWNDDVKNRVLTSPERAPELQLKLGGRAQVIGLPDLDAVRAVAWLRAQGVARVVIEAGPTAANALYAAEAPGVDHLFVSRFEGMFDPAAVGGVLVEPSRLFAGLSRVASSERTEESGPWRFERWDKQTITSA
jgi:riboflavin biosynthesis pyrimidine reductase